MKCLKCGNYESDKSICKNKGLNGEISIEATKIGTGDTAGTSYNTSLSYTNVEVLNNEYINSVEVKINMVENEEIEDDVTYFVLGKGEVNCSGTLKYGYVTYQCVC